MSETTQATEEKRSGSRWWLLLLLLLLLAGGAAYWWYFMRGGDGSFSLTFKGCDSQNKCGRFKLFAPGYSYRWNYDTTKLDPIDGQEPELATVIEKDLKKSKAVIATGLASREGSDLHNRQLSACRSKRLATLLDDAQATVGTSAQTYRISLGRYQQPPSEGDTQIERLLVMAFVLEADDGINLDEAMKAGLKSDLPQALKEVLAPIAAQLDFTSYACWNNEFHITPRDDVRSICYNEPSASYASFCSSF